MFLLVLVILISDFGSRKRLWDRCIVGHIGWIGTLAKTMKDKHLESPTYVLHFIIVEKKTHAIILHFSSHVLYHWCILPIIYEPGHWNFLILVMFRCLEFQIMKVVS